MRIPSGVTDQYLYFVAVDSADLKTRETGLSSFTVYRSRNSGAATVYTTPTVAELDATNMPGLYSLLLDEDMTLDAGDDSQEMAFHITQASMAPVTRTIELYRRTVSDGFTLGVESDGDLTKVNLCANTTLVDTTTVNTDVALLNDISVANILAATIDGAETLATTIKALLAVVAGTLAIDDSEVDPIVARYKDKAGSSDVVVHSIPVVAESGRTRST